MSKLAKVGYNGQRYAVHYIEITTGKQRTIGWCNKKTGEPLMKSAKLMPNARDPWVEDLRPLEGDSTDEAEPLPIDRLPENYPG